MVPLTLFFGRGLAFKGGMALGELANSDDCRKNDMSVAVAVVVIAGETFVTSISNHIDLYIDIYPYLQLYPYLYL